MNIGNCYPQRAIRSGGFHRSGSVIEFTKAESEQSIPDRFEQIVARYPDRIAVKTSEHTLSYDGLNKAANRVARAILDLRGEGNEPIALLFEPDVAAIIAILGVLKSGKFFVQIKPTHPHARNTYILGDVRPGLILTDSENVSLARTLAREEAQLQNIDELGSTLSHDNLALSFSPDTLAWVVYTSGSVGQPKGVVHSHRSALHFRKKGAKPLQICENDRVAAVGLDIFNPLINGAGSFPWNIKKQGLANLAHWLIQEEITVYRSFPTVFRHFVSTLTGKEEFPKLRLISLIGEPLYRMDVELFKKHFPSSCLLVNNLGSTETGTFRQYTIDKETKITRNVVPVGYGMEDAEVLLFDDDGKEVGVNCTGEIAVKSRYLSLGYWRRPELTQAKFLPDPNGEEKRIYLTGDLGRMSEDGCLEHLGRKDFQVKIRGFKADVGEVEAVLVEHPGVKEATVIAKEDRSGNTHLVAYLVAQSQPAPTVSALRDFLKEKLLDYMIPSAFVSLDRLPLTATGKFDRRALPDAENTRPELDTPYFPPRTPVEQEIAKIWAEILSLGQVGVHDNFFELGGHSLAATQVVSRVISIFQVEFSLHTFLEAPTVADMAAIILQSKVKQIGQEDLASIIAELEALSDDEAQDSLKKKYGNKSVDG